MINNNNLEYGPKHSPYKYYVYRHIRLDKNEPFYIGLGTKRPKDDGIYNRANSITSRNDIWSKIVRKTNYIVDILIESDDYEFIRKKEIEFIKLYGRINIRTGILSNMTDGGAGSYGRPQLETTRQKIREGHKGKLKGPQGITKKQTPEFRAFKSEQTKAYMNLPGSKEKLWTQKSCKPILQFEKTGEFIKEWPSIGRAAAYYDVWDTVIVRACKGRQKTAAGYVWKYKLPEKQ